jgi:RHS repeat-associated protein
MRHNYTYQAFGEIDQALGETDNTYLFGKEQYDQDLGNYYLRARYYDVDSGRFTKRDDYEGMATEPITLHKYTYANGDPINNVDPSGYSSLREGNWIHNLIGAHFFSQNGIALSFPLNPMRNGLFTETRVFDPRFPLNVIGIVASGSQNRPTNLRVIRTALGSPNHRGIPGLNRKVPDLVDFPMEEFYEIKPNNAAAIIDAQNKLQQAENEFQLVSGLSNWHRGSNYVLPSVPLVLPNGNLSSVRYHSPGLIVYDIYNTRLAVTAISLSSRILASAIEQLIASVISAAARSKGGAFAFA